MESNEREDWRRIFADTIIDLAGGNADMLQVASWAIVAQQSQGDQDPKEVATREFATGAPPSL